MPINVLPLLQSNQNQLAALQQAGQQQAGLLNAMNNQTPQIGGLTSDRTLQLSQPNTGNPIDQLGQLGALLQSQNNDAEKRKRQQDDLNFQREKFNFNRQNAIADRRIKAEDRNIRLQKEKVNEAKKTAYDKSIAARFSRINPAKIKQYLPTAIGADGKVDKTLPVATMKSVLDQMNSERSQHRITNYNNSAREALLDSKAKKMIDVYRQLNPGYVPAHYIQNLIDSHPQQALSFMKEDIIASKNVGRVVNYGANKNVPIFNKNWNKGAKTYVDSTLIRVDPSLATPDKSAFMESERKMVKAGVKALLDNTKKKTGTMKSLIDSYMSGLVVNSPLGAIVRSNYNDGWVNILGSDGQVHTVDLKSVSSNNDSAVMERASLLAHTFSDPKQRIIEAKKDLMAKAANVNGGLIDDMNLVDKAASATLPFTQSPAGQALGDLGNFLTDGNPIAPVAQPGMFGDL